MSFRFGGKVQSGYFKIPYKRNCTQPAFWSAAQVRRTGVFARAKNLAEGRLCRPEYSNANSGAALQTVKLNDMQTFTYLAVSWLVPHRQLHPVKYLGSTHPKT